MVVPQVANRRWSPDFASDALLDSRRFRILCVIDAFTRECLATMVDNSLSGVLVARKLDRLCSLRGRPDTIVSDNGTELTSNAILKWQQDVHVDWHYIAPGNPCRTGSSNLS
ncbi:transposase family protein [Pelagibius litoralis]|uniref:Transposase family protein n=1 Tax=Pelagibius litoralis TaxID=374515 RepID=A0A967KBX6_9PROT|nr:transposase family protein [Pelagibius litoralis]